jgi:hypothetical protein
MKMREEKRRTAKPAAAKAPLQLFAWSRWVSLYCVISFAVLGVDVAMNHRDVIHETPFAYIPIVFAPLALLLCMAAVFSQRWRYAAWGIGLLALLVGGAGTLFHLVPTITERGALPLTQALLTSPRPLLAPAAFASTGLLMLLVAWGERRQEKMLQRKP